MHDGHRALSFFVRPVDAEKLFDLVSNWALRVMPPRGNSLGSVSDNPPSGLRGPFGRLLNRMASIFKVVAVWGRWSVFRVVVMLGADLGQQDCPHTGQHLDINAETPQTPKSSLEF